MTTMAIDLDQPVRVRRSGRRRALGVVAGLVLLTATAAGASLVAASPPHLPDIYISAQWLPGSQRLPTVDLWYRDGTREDGTGRLHEQWRADRPIRLVVVVAEVGCRIEVDGRTVAADRTDRHRNAVCTWLAP